MTEEFAAPHHEYRKGPAYDKALKEGFPNNRDWTREYVARTGKTIHEAKAAYDADEPMPPATPRPQR